MRRTAALLSFLAALVVFQLTDTAAAAVKTFGPSADTYADQAQRNKSFGSAKRLRVRDGSLPARQGFVRFAVSGLAGSVTQATLRFYVTNGTPDGPAVYRTGAWPKKALTWARRPAVTSGPRGDKGLLVPGTWVEWDVTPWVTGNDAYRFALKGGAADTLELASRETKQGIDPQLVVTTSGPPPPDPPSTVVFVAPTQDAMVSDVREVRVRAPAGTEWVGVYACGGGSVGEDHVMGANGEWSVQWDTRTAACSNGTQDLDAWAFRDDGSDVGNATITVEVANSSPPPPPDPEPSPCPSAVPGPVEGQGYQLRFSDCFDTFSRSVWCSNQWYEPKPPPGTQYAEGGILHLVRRRSDGYPNVTVSSEPCGQASPKSFRQGYFEARLRWTGVPGSGPAFWLLSTTHATNPNWPQPACPQPTCLSAEIDVFEGYGNHLDVFTGTIHRNSCECYGAPTQMNSNNWQPQPGMNLSGWHVYGARWTSTNVTWYLDGRSIMSAPVYDSTNQAMHLLFYNWSTPWEPGNGTSAATPAELQTEVDWVRVWQQ